MTNNPYNDLFKTVRRLTATAVVMAFVLAVVLLLKFEVILLPDFQDHPVKTEDVIIENQRPGTIDEESGLIVDEGLDLVKAQCGACHSTKLVAQNRFTREGWVEVIRWMQKEQKLWDLGENEKPILDYLEKHLAPKKSGRRKKLENIEWYELEG